MEYQQRCLSLRACSIMCVTSRRVSIVMVIFYFGASYLVRQGIVATLYFLACCTININRHFVPAVLWLGNVLYWYAPGADFFIGRKSLVRHVPSSGIVASLFKNNGKLSTFSFLFAELEVLEISGIISRYLPAYSSMEYRDVIFLCARCSIIH